MDQIKIKHELDVEAELGKNHHLWHLQGMWCILLWDRVTRTDFGMGGEDLQVIPDKLWRYRK